MFFSFHYYYCYYLIFVMGQDIGQIYKHSQSQLSTSLFKAPVCSSLASHTSSSIESTTASIPSVGDKKHNNYFLCSQNFIHNYVRIANNDNIPSCETARQQNYSILNTWTTNHHTHCISNTSASLLNLHTSMRLPLFGKEYMCFQNDGKTAHAARCIK